MKDLTPKKLVRELDRHIVGQDAAKKAVAIAIRNRWRRQQLSEDQRRDVTPKNIIMIGPTGVGKTEIGRRLSHLVRAPFIKVEASKFTEVGYVGRDVESIVRDLADVAYNMVRSEKLQEVQQRAGELAEDRLLDLLLPPEDAPEQRETSREKMRQWLRQGKLEDKEVEITTSGQAHPMMQIFSSAGVEQMGFDFQNLMERMAPRRSEHRRLPVRDARQVLAEEEAEKLVDKEQVRKEALYRAENSGIVFLDEIDKVAGERSTHGPDVSREGVQRDLLPIVEGSTVATRFGMVRTDHILFIATGAFHMSKPSDLIPELQGRFPIRVELDPLGKDDFIRILDEPEGSLTKQYAALLSAEGTALSFDPASLEEIARIATEANKTQQDIGARRLQTVMEKLLEDVLFDPPPKKVHIDAETVRQKLSKIVEDQDLMRHIL